MSIYNNFILIYNKSIIIIKILKKTHFENFKETLFMRLRCRYINISKLMLIYNKLILTKIKNKK
jgi:hypothetical protein